MNRLMNLFRSRRLDAEIDEELQFHIEARVRDNIDAGMTAEEARRDAMRRFGGRLQAREGSHDADIAVWIETIAQDVRYAIRGLRKNPGATSIALLSLGLAIGANTAIFSIVNGVLLRALPYKDSGRLAMLWSTNRLNGAMEQNASLLNMDDWKARNHSFEDMAAYRESDGLSRPAPLRKRSGAPSHGSPETSLSCLAARPCSGARPSSSKKFPVTHAKVLHSAYSEAPVERVAVDSRIMAAAFQSSSKAGVPSHGAVQPGWWTTASQSRPESL